MKPPCQYIPSPAHAFSDTGSGGGQTRSFAYLSSPAPLISSIYLVLYCMFSFFLPHPLMFSGNGDCGRFSLRLPIVPLTPLPALRGVKQTGRVHGEGPEDDSERRRRGRAPLRRRGDRGLRTGVRKDIRC